MFHSLNYFDTLFRIFICVINYNVGIQTWIRSTYFFLNSLFYLNVKTNNFKNIVAVKEKKISDPVLFIVLTAVEYISLQSNTHPQTHEKIYSLMKLFCKKKYDFFPLYRTKITSNNLTKFSLCRKIAKQFSETFQIDLTVTSEKSRKKCFRQEICNFFFFLSKKIDRLFDG